MSKFIPDTFITDLLVRADIVDVVNKRVTLKKAGRNYTACCPFHQEKTPSFSVSPDKQFYHCFGCGVSGDAIQFLREFERMDFYEAVTALAQEVGVELPKQEQSKSSRPPNPHKPLYELLKQATDYYQRMLRSHPQKQQAVAYLQNRGLSGQAAQHFAIGFAPEGWQNLSDALIAANPKQAEKIKQQLLTTGMSVQSEKGRQYDRFRQRIMFPIRNLKGQVIAFGGRVLNDDKPKYLNSPETPLFQKSNELYGLYEARKTRQTLTRLLLVEGYMDVIGLAQHGIHYAVATLGTSTSEVHLQRIFKMVPEVIFCFDGDEAGSKAAERAMQLCLPLLKDGLQARFLFLPTGEDPDSLVAKEGKHAFEQRLKLCPHLPEFLIAHTKEKVDFDSIDGKARFDQLIAPLVNQLPQGMLRELVEDEISKQLGRTSVALEKLKHQGKPTDTANTAKPMPSDDAKIETPKAHMTLIQKKALTALVLEPSLVEDITQLPDIQPDNEYDQLILDIIKRLKKTPTNDTPSMLVQHSNGIYHGFLKQLADSGDPQIPRSVVSILAPLNRVELMQLEHEHEQLKHTPNKTPAQMQRIIELGQLIREKSPKRRRNKIYK